ncbi:hypothetical protein [Brevibacillus brevis]|uniref:hypothetical protein n=1 Tax=Brevibacillus brevis TaxID=1393 RepID=UPI0025A4CF3C|nr:hypothetical protein [Brevibacillus brevis]WJQ83809.1 hypothetical protein QN310_12020 [Brevibacillus brevis]
MNNLVSLGDLFRRVPELQPVVHEYLNKPPLSFHVGHADKNNISNFEERKARGFSFALNEGISEQIDPSLPITTYIAFHTDGTCINTDF